MNGVGLYVVEQGNGFCRECSAPVVMMCQQGTGFCSLNCQDAAHA